MHGSVQGMRLIVFPSLVCFDGGSMCVNKGNYIDNRACARYNSNIKRRCQKRLRPLRLLVYTRNRHLAEWRFLLFTLIVIVYPKICNVTVIGIEHTPFRVVWRNRLFTLGNTLVSVYRIRGILSTSDSTGTAAGFSPGRETGRRFFCKYTA